MPEELIGKVTHYFDRISVAVISLEKGELAVGDTVKFKQGEKEFQQLVGSLEVDKQPVGRMSQGEEAGTKVDEPVNEGWEVYKVVE